MRRKQIPLPARIEGLRNRFESWRRTKNGRGATIPKDLWKAAIKLTEHYSVNRVARALRLNGTELKRRAMATRRTHRPTKKAPTFVEVDLSPTTNVPACIIEMENSDGAKLRISIKDREGLDLVTLGKSFWSQGE